MPKLVYLRSLRGRYAALACGLLLAILTGVLFGRAYVSTSKSETTDQIAVRNQLQLQSRLIRDAVWNAREAMESFLLDPHKGRRGMEIIDAIDRASAQAGKVGSNPWLQQNKLGGEVRTITATLGSLRTNAQLFIRTRLDAQVQYPAMGLARDDMLPAQASFASAIELALDELSATPSDPVFIRLSNVRYLWSLLISQYRMYLANRVGSFEVATLADQEKDAELYLDQIAREIAVLEAADRAGNVGFQGSISLQQMRGSFERWKKAYGEVKHINASGNWRTDALIIQGQLDPMFRTIWQALVNIDQVLEVSANADIETMSDVSRTLMDGLWILALAGLIVVVAVYASLELVILRPVAQVTKALKLEAAGESDFSPPHAHSRETQDLVDAFTHMRNQVRSRQLELEHSATHDGLTGLVNRAGLNERLDQAIRSAKRSHNPLSLLIMDLDGFKDVNDTLGHPVGDALLRQVGLRLQSALREMDTVCRLGGDEFAILLVNTDEQQSAMVAKKLVSAMHQNFMVEDQALYVAGSIGIASYPFHGDTPQALIQRADVAMYVAKRNRGGHAIYDAKQDDHSIGRLSLLSDLRDALNNDGLELYYQPQIEISTRKIIGAEALLRWNHPEHGFVPPEQIIPMAEQTGLIQQLTAWVLTKAYQQIRAWQIQGLYLQVAVNLSVHNLQNGDIVEHVRNGLKEYELDSRLLVLEVTESAMMADPARAIEVLNELDRLNVGISVDDFGTGFSSLAYLKKLPVDELKIDRSFVMDMISDDNDAVIVRSTIDLAHNLGLKVVAEGVEDNHAFDLLEILGCDFAQGFHFSRPVPIQALDEWLISQVSTGLHSGAQHVVVGTTPMTNNKQV